MELKTNHFLAMSKLFFFQKKAQSLLDFRLPGAVCL